jgi:mRNA interferase MazF
MHRGAVYEADVPGVGQHPVVIVSREQAIPVLPSVVAAIVTSTIRGHPAEVALGAEQGLDHESVANCDSIHTIPKGAFHTHRGSLGPTEMRRLDMALRIALALD